MRKSLIVVCALVTLTATAQTRGGIGFGGFRNGAGFTGHSGRGFGARSSVWYGDPFFYSDYAAPAYAPPMSPVVIVQPAASAVAPAEPKSEPLMIEWQGDKYVRFGSEHESVRASALDYSEARSSSSSSTGNIHGSFVHPASPSELPPAILIFRDGHHENVSDYVIANGNLYARGDYWRDGFWTKTVELSALDIPATLRANSDSGVKFILPSGPNEVVTRP
jgi:hypothetical protein